jgi:hypothetical protein
MSIKGTKGYKLSVAKVKQRQAIKYTRATDLANQKIRKNTAISKVLSGNCNLYDLQVYYSDITNHKTIKDGVSNLIKIRSELNELNLKYEAKLIVSKNDYNHYNVNIKFQELAS